MRTTYMVFTELAGYSPQLRIGQAVTIPICGIQTLKTAYFSNKFSEREISEITNPLLQKIIKNNESFGTIITYTDDYGNHKRVCVLENLDSVEKFLHQINLYI